MAELKGANVEKLKELVESHRKPLSIQGEDFWDGAVFTLYNININCSAMLNGSRKWSEIIFLHGDFFSIDFKMFCQY